MRAPQADLVETQILGPDTREVVAVAGRGAPFGDRPIVSAGVSLARPGFHFARPRPRWAAALLCFGGEGEALVDGAWIPCRRGHAYLLPAKSPHAYRATGRWTLGWATYGRGAGTLPLAAGAPPRLVAFEPEPLRGALMGLLREARGAADPVPLRHWAELLHLELERALSGGVRGRRLDRLWAAVDADPARAWTAASLAAAVGLGEERLRQVALAMLGRSPMRQVRHLRLSRAAHLLRSTDRRIEEIAAAVGYGDPYAFSTAFRRWSGASPRAYREGG